MFVKIIHFLLSIKRIGVIYKVKRNKKSIYKLIKEGRNVLGNNEEKKIIVSLTSYCSRFDVLPDAINSIFLQTLRPDRVILYLDEDVEYNNLPKRLVQLCDIGLEIYVRQGLLKPHKKYYYAISENPDDIVITVDDDILYNKYVIEDLMSEHIKHPDSVVATRAHRILFDDNGMIKPYLEWEWESDIRHEEREDLLATGVGGVLYPPHCLDERAFSIEKIQRLCLDADDIWLRFMESLVGTKVCLCNGRAWKKSRCLQREDIGLNVNNCVLNGNDEYIRLMMDEFSGVWDIEIKDKN